MLKELLELKAEAEHEMVYAQAKLEVVNKLIAKLEPMEEAVEEVEPTDEEASIVL